jgi:sensor histidine kinase YesM
VLLSDLTVWVVPAIGGLRWLVYGATTVNYIGGYVGINFFIRYLGEIVPKHERTQRGVLLVFDILCVLSSLAVLISLPFGFFFSIDEQGIYEVGPYYWVANLYSLAALALAIITICTARGVSMRDRAIFLSYPILPLIGMSVDYFVGDLVLTYVGSFLAILMIYLKFYTQRGIQLAQQEAELAQSRTAIMLSQIQPHFLYNALATIKHLCAKQDPRAEEVVAKFSKYLRGNMDSLTNTMPIPFKSELNHLENYLTIERLRFPDVHIAYDLKTTAFALPALTVQPLVENAIRYGVTRNEDGAGTVTISSYEDESAWYVRIKDDGVGFNPEQVQYDGRSHIGISNTRQRLATMCQGTLDIKSVRDVGTTITVTLPKDGEACMR